MLRPGRQANGGLPSYGGSGSSTGSNGNGSFGVGYGGGGSNAGGYGGYGSSPSGGMHQNIYQEDNKYASKRRGSHASSTAALLFRDKFVVALVVCFLLFCTTLYYRGSGARMLKQLGVQSLEEALDRLDSIHGERDQWRKDTKRTIQDTRAMDDRNRRLEEKNRQLEKDAEDLKKKLAKLGDGGGDSSEGHKKTVEHYAKRDTAWRHQVHKLQNATARESKRAALDLFGAGPHRVKLNLHLPDDMEPNPKHYFVVELAPLDIMPHAVHLFLEQVNHKLWDNTWFYLNGPHVLQAGPQAYEDEDDPEDEAKLHEFTKRQLDTLSFPEYSTSYPHVQWTIGFTGRPGGPDWYINKSDNTRTHGPGGQRQHTLLEQADPCFGKVVEGFDVLERLFKLEVYDEEDYENFFVEPVEILTARMYYGDDHHHKEESAAPEHKPEQKHDDKHHEEHHKGKPIKSHRAEEEDDDILSDEDWDEDWEDYHYDEHHEDHH